MRAQRPQTRDTSPSDFKSRFRWSRRAIAWVAVCGIVVLAGGCAFFDWWRCLPDDRVATYVGRQSCAECHAPEMDAWAGSHHDLAMDLATPETVVGDFDDAELTHHDVTCRMYRQDDKFVIRTEGPEGTLEDFEIKYVLGVDPLQQYMVEFDRPAGMPENEIGRVQVLRVSWDTHRKKWFYLPPPDVDEKLSPDDDLHWTGIAQRWNNMCADCHSTDLKKNYDPEKKVYHTTFSEIDVSCEACHGPGSLHIELAKNPALFWDRKRGYGLARLKGDDSDAQIHACAPCHSRRRVVRPGWQAGENYYDHFANELLESHTYYADGQILDEVYVYGSFIQSKMYHNDIRCTDCHDPHTARTKFPGNALCTSCHQHPAGKYDSVAHHRHKADRPGALCVECHMPETTYMEVDPRRDHSLRIPRPDLSVRLGTPDACSRCHLEEAQLDPQKAGKLDEYADWLIAARNGDEEVRQALARVDRWSAEKFTEWYGEKEDVGTHFAHTIAAARRGEPEAEQGLALLSRDRRLPAIVRATALSELGRFGANAVAETSAELLRMEDLDPQVRTVAIANLQPLPDEPLVRRVAPFLTDPECVVRTEAARVLARVPDSLLKGRQRHSLRKALGEFERGVLVSGDRAAAHLTLGVLHESRRDSTKARKAYELARHVEPQVSGPRTNLAALLDRLAGEAEQRAALLQRSSSREAEKKANEALQLRDEATRLRGEELELLARDAQLVPESAAIHYRYGLSLYLHDRNEEAERHLREACDLEPNSPDFVLALALFYQKHQRFREALKLVDRLITLRPQDASYRQLVNELRAQAARAESRQ